MRDRDNTVTQADMDSEDFMREPKLNVLRVGSAKLVSKASVQTAVEPWLTRLALGPDAFVLARPPVGSQFEVVFRFVTNSPVEWACYTCSSLL